MTCEMKGRGFSRMSEAPTRAGDAASLPRTAQHSRMVTAFPSIGPRAGDARPWPSTWFP